MAKNQATRATKSQDSPKTQKSPTQKGDKKAKKSTEEKPTPVVAATEESDDEWEDDDEMADGGTQLKPKSSKKEKKSKRSKKAAAAAAAAAALGDEEDDGSDESDDEEMGYNNHGIDLAGIDDSDSDSEFEKEEVESASEADEESDIDIDDLSIHDEEDDETIAALTRTRETINNKEGLLAALRRFQLDVSSVPFVVHQSVISKTPTETAIGEIDDDLSREMAFMNQALEAARTARAILRKEGVPFTRPVDYFAETLRSDATMELVKAKLIEEATSKKASAEARKLRDLKKFGKQVQVAKQQERAKEKRTTLDKISQLKKKRKEGASSALGAQEADDLFDVAVDNELGSGAGKKRGADGDHGRPNKRVKKDAKFGFGGKKRHSKSNDAMSASDLSTFSAKRMKSHDGGDSRGGRGGGRGGGGAGRGGGRGGGKSTPRMGKSKRKTAAGRS
ncbi:eukaryotic rRNA processing protein EBP2-domain-containing protein [Podospora didyma]|uniref:Eukaryotic rRNA processing protein EBP2-domain-containing protein n=1 Tax=Podospora didyma TaxID=330526 RepID=A0AAE0KKC4_9PEZI|nr:eukaryotic rRNA processing protein EBP2-domain-containing protein [Podospora didyma]